MIVVTYKAGRLANRLFHFSNFIVSSRAHDYKLIYPFFDKYAQYFSYFSDRKINDENIYLTFTRVKLFDRLIKVFVKYFFNYKFFIGRHNFNLLFFKQVSNYKPDLNNIEFDLNNPLIVNNHQPLLGLNGWLFRDRKSHPFKPNSGW